MGSKCAISSIRLLVLWPSILTESSRMRWAVVVSSSYVEQGFFQRWWKEQNDATKAVVHKLVENGQFEFNMGGWSMADEAATNYEDVINEMTLGAKFIYDEFGVRPTVAWSIDPFGHSKEIEALYADIGFDAFGINRVHYKDKEDRIKNQKLEFVWRGSNSQGAKSDMFIHMMDNHYCSPSECDFFSNSAGECMYRTKDEAWFQDDADLPTYKVNAEEKAQAFVKMVKERATYYDNGNNLLITWGCDFTHLSAPIAYANMDKLIKYVNANEDRFGVHVQYAVFGDYIKAVNKHKKQWEVYEGDFMPYASDPDAYWTGYYTSRGRTKGINRRVMNELSAAELYLSLAKVFGMPVEESLQKIMKLRKAQGEFQHHDAITGTEKQAVANDYVVQMEDGSFFANEATSATLGAILDVNVNHNITIKWEELNGKRLGVILVNPNGWTMKNVFRAILPVDSVQVSNAKGEALPMQMMAIPEWSIDRRNGTHYVYVEVEVPPMGFTTIYFNPNTRMRMPFGQKVETNSIENDVYRLTFERGLLATVELKEEGRIIPFTDKLYHYKGRCNGGRCSGAYSFIPEYDDPDAIGEEAELTILKGELMEEARIVYRDGYRQIIRLYKVASEMGRVMEYVYDFEETDEGREIVVRFASDKLKNDRVMFTDGNGLEDIRRKYRHDDVMAVSANYYPISNRVWMQDAEETLRLSINVDRAHGVASVVDGVLEVMLRRRTVGDDWFGVDEPLKENDHYQQTLWVNLAAPKNAVALHKKLDFHLNHAPLPYYFVAEKVVEPAQQSMLKKDMPANVQLMTFQLNQAYDKDFLLRFHHIYTKGEKTELAEKVVFDVNEYFSTFQVKKMKEYVLSGMFPREQVEKERLQWEIKEEMRQPEEEDVERGEFEVELTPMGFKTYRIEL